MRAVLVYVALLVTLRIFGKREVGQFTLYDLVFILLVANALQPAITGPDSSLVGGLVLIVALVLTNFIVGRLDSIPRLHRLFAAPPAVVVRNGKFQRHAMQREGVMPGEIEMAAREHGLKDVKEVELATLEEDGTISIVGTGATQHGRRRGRFRQRPGN